MNYIENNKLIAEFMEFDFTRFENDGIIEPKKESVFEKFGYTFSIDLEELKFNSDWNWLFPVIFKILSLDKNGNSDYLHLKNMPLSVAINREYVYSKVVSFIQWYNQQKL